jgi:hypothetical protein
VRASETHPDKSRREFEKLRWSGADRYACRAAIAMTTLISESQI